MGRKSRLGSASSARLVVRCSLSELSQWKAYVAWKGREASRGKPKPIVYTLSEVVRSGLTSSAARAGCLCAPGLPRCAFCAGSSI